MEQNYGFTKSLFEVIEAETGQHATLIKAAFESVGATDWDSLQRIDTFKGVRKYILEHCDSGSTYTARLAAAIAPYDGEMGTFSREWRKQLRIAQTKTQQTYLSVSDIRALALYAPFCQSHTYLRQTDGGQRASDLAVLVGVLIEARTGARLSDVKDVDEYNVGEDGMLTYKSKKTGVFASIPVSPELMFLLRLHKALNIKMTDRGYTFAFRRVARNAGLTYKIKLNGEIAEKFEFLSSHDCRRGFCTNLHLGGEELLTISRMAGHSNTTMTERYICATRRPNAEKFDYFEVIDGYIREGFKEIMEAFENKVA